MLCHRAPFFNAKCLTEVVHEDGQKAPLEGANLFDVLAVMVIALVSEYRSLPDYRTLSATEIRFFYRGLESELKERARLRAEADKK